MARSIAAVAGNSSRNRAVLMLAAVFGLLSAVLVFAFLNGQGGGDSADEALSPTEGAESVVVMTRNVNVGEKITADMLTTRTLPRSLVLAGGSASADNLVGKVATTPLFAGEQVLLAKVTSFDGQNAIAYKVPDGMRAISIQVPHEAWIAAGLIQPGDRVDVLAILTLTEVDPLTGEEKPKITGAVIAEDVEILAMSQVLVKTIPNLDAKKPAADATAGDTGAATGTPGASAPVASGDPLKDADTYEKAISVTLALPPELAAGMAIVDAIKDDVAQYRLMPRQKGDGSKLSGATSWSLDDVLAGLKKK